MTATKKLTKTEKLLRSKVNRHIKELEALKLQLRELKDKIEATHNLAREEGYIWPVLGDAEVCTEDAANNVQGAIESLNIVFEDR